MKIRADDVRKEYGSVTALDGLSLEVPAGSTFGLLGTNGAGKTTLFKLLVGLDRPDAGRLSIGGRDVAASDGDLREVVGYLPERVGFPPALTGREVLAFHARIRGLPTDGRIADVVETVGLSQDDADRAVDGYSNGMRRRLGLAAAVLPRPEVLVLDEPTAGLDPVGVAEFHTIIERIRRETGATVLLSSHALTEIERLCDRVAIVDRGRVLDAGRVEDLLESDAMTVRLRPGDAVHVDYVAARASEFGPTSAAGGTVTVRCPAESIPRLFADLHRAVELADVTVERAGLDVAFHDALAEVDG